MKLLAIVVLALLGLLATWIVYVVRCYPLGEGRVDGQPFYAVLVMGDGDDNG